MPAPSPDHAHLIRQLEAGGALSKADTAVLAALPLRIRPVAEGRDVVGEGSVPVECCLVLEGVVCRYKTMSGGRRRVLSLHLPGDMPDLQSLFLKTMDHSLASITLVRVAFVPDEAVRALVRAPPGIADAFSRHTVDSSICRGWIAGIGPRTSLERVAHLMSECFVGMRRGPGRTDDFELPLSQTQLGDATGLLCPNRSHAEGALAAQAHLDGGEGSDGSRLGDATGGN